MTLPTQPTREAFRLNTLHMCPECRLWVVDLKGIAVEPLLPRNAHAIPWMIGSPGR